MLPSRTPLYPARTASPNRANAGVRLSGWKCDKCPPKTAAKLKALNGVESATADRGKGEVVVKYDDAKAKHADLEKAVADSGFSVAK